MELKRANQFIRPIDLPDAAIVILDGIMQGVVTIGCPDNGPAEVRNPAHPVAREPDQSAIDVLLGKEQSVIPIADSVAFPVAL
jgi:hypothetical protein